MANKQTENTTHVRPNFTIKTSKADVEKAQKKIESLREKEADLVEELNQVRAEIAEQGTVRGAHEPGFSNVDGKAQKEATKKLGKPVNEASQAATNSGPKTK